jgi:type IV secretory pathway VirB10-like protein
MEKFGRQLHLRKRHMDKSYAGRWQLRCGIALGCVLMACSALAHAQYVWLDEKGSKQFSDRPPPSSVPAKRILKAPGAAPHVNVSVSAPADAADENAPAKEKKAAPTLAERNADFRKRQTEQAEQEHKSDDDARRKADLASNCKGARHNQQTLASGVRIGVAGKDGERAYMSDEERAQQTKNVKRILEDCAAAAL